MSEQTEHVAVASMVYAAVAPMATLSTTCVATNNNVEVGTATAARE